MNKHNHRQLRTMAGDGYTSDDNFDGESCSDIRCELSGDGDELEGMTQAVTLVLQEARCGFRAGLPVERALVNLASGVTPNLLKRCSVFPSRNVHSASVASACCQPALTQVLYTAEQQLRMHALIRNHFITQPQMVCDRF